MKVAQDSHDAKVQELQDQSERSAFGAIGRDQRPDAAGSGELSQHLLDLVGGSRVARADLTVTGETFHGKVGALSGATVKASPVAFSGDGVAGSPSSTDQAFIVDFGRSLSVLELEVLDPGVAITLVLPWLGTGFSPASAYPGGGGSVPSAGEAWVGLTGVETTKLLVQLTGTKLPTATTLPGSFRITTGTYPANVKASLNGRLPFWTNPGPLSGTVQPTGLVEDLNGLLASAKGTTSVTLILSTDTPGVLTVAFDPSAGTDTDQIAPARWGGQASTQLALRSLEPQTVTVPFPTDSTAAWAVTALDLDLTGTFPPWRAHDVQTTAPPGKLGLRVDARFAVARRFQPEQATQLYGVALLVRPGADDAQVHVELAKEKDGSPAPGKPLAAADVTVAASGGSAGGTPAPVWQEVMFASPVKLRSGDGIWVSAKAKTGAIELAGAPETPGAATRTLVAADGGSWDRYPPVGDAAPVAQIRVLRAPFPEENAPLLTLDWADGAGGGPAAAEPAGATTTVQLTRPTGPFTASPAGGTASVALTMTAASTGTLTVKGATAAYGAASP